MEDLEKERTLWDRLTPGERKEVKKEYRKARGQFVANRNAYVRATNNGKMQVLESLFGLDNIG